MDNLFMTTEGPLVLPVPCTQERTELENLIRTVREINPTRVVEIGAFLGGTTYCWATHLGDGVKVAAVDDYETIAQVQYPVKGYNSLPTRWTLQELWREWGDVECFFGKSAEVYPDVQAQFDGCDFLFIDGDHSYEGAKRDFELYGGLVRPGGLIALHDIINYSGVPENNVQPLWEEIKQGHETTELFSREGQTWMGIGVVHVR